MHAYFDEKKAALVLWQAFLESLLDGTAPPRWGEDPARRKKAKSR